MKTIEDADYDEYQKLKKWAREESIYISSKEITNLRDDIDYPIRKCVAMLALLKYMPIYSCCGFDYIGQPFHKHHQYGEPYIMLWRDSFHPLIETQNLYMWKIKTNGQTVFIELDEKYRKAMNPHWREPTCPHYSEEMVIAINHLEYSLFSFNAEFLDEVILKDTNNQAQKQLKYWQYVPKKEWKITKDDIIWDKI